MIQYVSATGSDLFCFLLDGILFGPVSGQAIWPSQTISVTHPEERMDQIRGICGENHVNHMVYEGLIHYHPLLGQSQSNPQALYPRQTRVRVQSYAGSNTYWLDCGFGAFVHKGTSYGRLDHPLHFAFQVLDTGKLRVWKVQMQKDNPLKIEWYGCSDLNTLSPFWEDIWTNTWINYPSKSSLSLSGYPTPGIDWTKPVDFDTIVHLLDGEDQFRPQFDKGYVAGGSYLNMRRVIPASMLSIEDVRTLAQAEFRRILNQGNPCEDIDYGDLAMKASEQVNSTNVNVIEFLRDIRHPTHMIPKLKNLKKLKSYANAYLTTHYGLMPTISDLKEIVEALDRRVPYLDRNGFSTYSAGHSDTRVVGDAGNYVTWTLCKRLKLAVGVEDNAFEDLVGRFEDWGMWPTFENIWDLVPYSFMIDWFADVGEFLERVDSRLRLIRLNIKYATLSQLDDMSSFRAATIESPYTFDLHHRHYHRWVTDQCPQPRLSLQSELQDLKSHWLEAGALLIQRSK